MRNTILVLFLGLLIKPFSNIIFNKSNENCVSVAPSGVSGFWQILPRIRKIAKDKKILCASSGCLASVAKDLDFHYTYNLASFLKYENISYQDKKNEFIKIITKKIKKIPHISIVTMDIFGNCYKSIAKNKTHLMQLLVETSDIPYFTTQKPGKRMDGIFCFYKLDKCKTKIRHSFSLKVLLNLLNLNLTELEIMELYNYNGI